ncbi:MAG TPA: hypothetical protein VEY09_13525 [Pyrinomonadaceae bacterium]|nr:hypothetical protein [Pyrinomonadaceae bacterium]
MRKTLFPSLALIALALALSHAPAAVGQEADPAPARPATPATPARPEAEASEAPAPAPAPDPKAEAVLRRAVEALGGQAYLSVRTVVSRGNYTPFEDGMAGLPIKFVDYLVFPDRERTEFSGTGVKSVQTNVGEGGWVLDQKARKLTDVTAEGAKEFRLAMRTSLDSALRGWWRQEGAALEYAGRREAAVGRRNEVVRVTYPDGFAVEYEFSAHDGMPAKARYKKETREGDSIEEEDRYAQFLNVGSIRAPFVVDHFRAGVQSSRVNFEEIRFNAPVPDSLFARPAEGKAAK